MDHQPDTSLESPPTSESTIQHLKSAHIGSTFRCYAIAANTKSRCNARFRLPPHETDAALELVHHGTPPYSARQATGISRLLLCPQHYQSTEYSASFILGLVEWNTRAEPGQKQQRKSPVLERHDSLSSGSHPASAPPTRPEAPQTPLQDVHALLDFFDAKWELFLSTELRCIGYTPERTRCQFGIQKPARTAAQDALGHHVLRTPPMGILRALVQHLLCPTHSSSTWVDAYREKWATHFLPMYSFGSGDEVPLSRTWKLGGAASAPSFPSTSNAPKTSGLSGGPPHNAPSSSRCGQVVEEWGDGFDNWGTKIFGCPSQASAAQRANRKTKPRDTGWRARSSNRPGKRLFERNPFHNPAYQGQDPDEPSSSTAEAGSGNSGDSATKIASPGPSFAQNTPGGQVTLDQSFKREAATAMSPTLLPPSPSTVSLEDRLKRLHVGKE